MGTVAEKELDIINVQEETDDPKTKKIDALIVIPAESLTTPNSVNKYTKWLEIGIYALIVLVSQTVATILGKLYYNKGGKSTWVISLTETIAFPILLIPMIFNCTNNNNNKIPNLDSKSPSLMTKLFIYVFLGFLVGIGCGLFSIGLLHLPASTFSLISSSQLAFNVLFSLFMKLEKITPLIANSITLVTISSLLLAIDSSNNASSYHHNAIGFICTLIASALFGLLFSLTDLYFRKFFKKSTLREFMDVIICQSFFATCIILIGLFASKNWRNLKTEMNNFEVGRLAYIMILIWISVCWQLYTYCLLGLIMKVSAVFANVITTLGAPLIPIMSVIIFNDKMSGVKAISIVLAIWGFSSYAYQQYLDELNHKDDRNEIEDESTDRQTI
ncbi:purine permease 21-like isoform X1 [Solanum lycopersicum]|uniref:Probable purine permease n=1 Tax=Solanum lycopersicum TaxID=4081 RepID=A0A3Q7F282_SOLLC|nr:purine permease 21-like isoform X1 [Solanum lycopersicum]